MADILKPQFGGRPSRLTLFSLYLEARSIVLDGQMPDAIPVIHKKLSDYDGFFSAFMDNGRLRDETQKMRNYIAQILGTDSMSVNHDIHNINSIYEAASDFETAGSLAAMRAAPYVASPAFANDDNLAREKEIGDYFGHTIGSVGYILETQGTDPKTISRVLTLKAEYMGAARNMIETSPPFLPGGRRLFERAQTYVRQEKFQPGLAIRGEDLRGLRGKGVLRAAARCAT